MTVDVIAAAAVGDWQAQLRAAITSPAQLAAALALDPAHFGDSAGAAADFALRVPQPFLARMRRGDPDDPLLRQVMAAGVELQAAPGFNDDPVGEVAEANPRPGIVRKYAGRALLLVAGGCAVNCRYCFRRHFPYGENALSRAECDAALTWLADEDDIEELILSGGDPLLAGDRYLAELVDALHRLPRLKTLRVHTRLPVVIPDRVTAGLLDALDRDGLRTVLVLHANHGNEIDRAVQGACERLRGRGITLLNQAVLLAGVNDSADALAGLSDALWDAGVLPYYLHLLDPVRGAAHFAVPDDRAQRLVGELATRKPGYLVPRLVREVPGAASKRELAPAYPA
ncbi:EF-P beta-lysylation protein EpmB [Pseudohaliea rubra]|uniref:L-lysine 2,3-aminomutase n=1 Tax=Pseudohaliea rubra DSM 19751 TaxID=1265313 RepID=A0A095VUW3_9GAMM|nr:EF-P beta-lysylation protein EpmB [Pseudohaliea rubra]KGE04863.1 Lysine 2,3-aminomutase [Pseudohaliea rubra DSM 19751]